MHVYWKLLIFYTSLGCLKCLYMYIQYIKYTHRECIYGVLKGYIQIYLVFKVIFSRQFNIWDVHMCIYSVTFVPDTEKKFTSTLKKNLAHCLFPTSQNILKTRTGYSGYSFSVSVLYTNTKLQQLSIFFKIYLKSF